MLVATNEQLDTALTEAENVARVFNEVKKGEWAESMNASIASVRQQRFVIGVVGAAKRGKSTLINGLLGRSNDDCAPIDEFPATNVVSIFGRSDELSVKVVFADNTIREITEHEIRLYVTEKHNAENRKKVRSVEMFGDFPGLERGVYVVDTPGANNALSSMHGEILLEFLPVADAVVFLVAADEPLTEAEKKLLKAIHGNNTRKLFFAVNKVDRVDSGDLDSDEIAQGIEHNRRILADAGFQDASIYEISARNYFQTQTDRGTERLLKDIRELIDKERLHIMHDRLRDNMRSLVEKCRAELSSDLREAKATAEEIEEERKALVAARKELRKGKANRERLFSQEWHATFNDLNKDLRLIRIELIDDYSILIDKASPMRVPALAQTIHADVQVSFSERFRPRMEKCEERLNAAMEELRNSVDQVMLNLTTQITAGPIVQSVVKDSIRIGGAVIPALVTGTLSAVLPGIIGSMIAGAAPAVATITWNPATWFTAATTTVATGTGAIVTTALSTIAMPIAIAAFGLGGFRAYSTWREVKNMQKNDLKSKVIHMVDDGFSQLTEQIGSYRKLDAGILAALDESIERSIEDADKRLELLIVNRPSPQQVKLLENSLAAVERHTVRLVAAESKGEKVGSMSEPVRLLVDDLRLAQ